ncbi:MAG: hypothetical protein LBO64_03715 [Desulfovibrio sp.]|jgi:hypothetical protein|nr:hypothetical protein [Desulfovibrio sp.]
MYKSFLSIIAASVVFVLVSTLAIAANQQPKVTIAGNPGTVEGWRNILTGKSKDVQFLVGFVKSVGDENGINGLIEAAKLNYDAAIGTKNKEKALLSFKLGWYQLAYADLVNFNFTQDEKLKKANDEKIGNGIGAFVELQGIDTDSAIALYRQTFDAVKTVIENMATQSANTTTPPQDQYDLAVQKAEENVRLAQEEINHLEVLYKNCKPGEADALTNKQIAADIRLRNRQKDLREAKKNQHWAFLQKNAAIIVSSVKTSYLDNYPKEQKYSTVGKAFESFFDNPLWEFVIPQNRIPDTWAVSFTGIGECNGKKARFGFIFNGFDLDVTQKMIDDKDLDYTITGYINSNSMSQQVLNDTIASIFLN